MSTYMPKAGDISRAWYVLDADGRTLGEVAAEAATLLRGKHKPTPCGLRRPRHHHQCRKGCFDRQQTRTEKVLSSHRVHRQYERSRLQNLDG